LDYVGSGADFVFARYNILGSRMIVGKHGCQSASLERASMIDQDLGQPIISVRAADHVPFTYIRQTLPYFFSCHMPHQTTDSHMTQLGTLNTPVDYQQPFQKQELPPIIHFEPLHCVLRGKIKTL
jgi:hypothetical protein